MENKNPTIEEVINQENGQWIIINSVVFFKDQHLPSRKLELFKIRQHIVIELRDEKYPYICSFCKYPVKISGGGSEGGAQSLHFRHANRSPKCIYHENSKLSREQILRIKFNGAKESYQHEYLKNTIASILEKDESYQPLKVEVEKVIRSQSVSQEWRKPDVKAIYSDKEIVFELQLSTTFVDVILERSIFYKQEKCYLLWILDEFSTDLGKQSFSQIDILVSSNYNIFVFDKEMEELSKKEKGLHLKCHYIYYKNEKNKLSSPLWGTEIITLQQLHYDKEYRAYYCDTGGIKDEVLEEIELEKEKRRQQFYERHNLEIEPYHQEKRIDYRYQRLIDLIKDSRDEKYFAKLEVEFKQLTDTEMDELSDLIQDHITKWYMESAGQYFVRFILEQERLYINLHRLTVEGTSPLFYLVNRGYEKDVFYACIHSFFKRGYQPSSVDKKGIINYITHILEKGELEDDYLYELERNAIALQYIRLYDSDIKDFDVLYKGKGKTFILKILSVLSNRIIGSSEANFKSMANSVARFHKEYIHLFIMRISS